MKKLLSILIISFLLFSCNNAPTSKTEEKTFAATLTSFTGGAINAPTVIANQTITSFADIYSDDVTIINCKFSGAASGIRIMKKTQRLRVYNCTATGVQRFLDLDANRADAQYTGNGFWLSNSTIDSLNIDGGYVVYGNPGGPYNPWSWTDSVAVTRWHYTSNESTHALIWSTGMFRSNIHHFSINISVIPPTGLDFAMFVIAGNGQIHDSYRSGGWGWDVRLFACSVKGQDNNFYAYNNTDLNHANYGGIEMRVETPGQLGQFLNGTNISAKNNYCGNYKDAFNGYSNNSVLIMAMDTKYTCEITGNILFNAQNPFYHDIGVKTGVGSQNNYKPTIASNNTYSPTAPPIIPPVVIPPVVIPPVNPPVVKQRTVKSFSTDGVHYTFLYDDNSTSTLP